MSASNEIIIDGVKFYFGIVGSYPTDVFDNAINMMVNLPAELQHLRAAVTERDAAIEKAVKDERVQCAALARAMIGANRREIADAILSRTERTIP